MSNGFENLQENGLSSAITLQRKQCSVSRGTGSKKESLKLYWFSGAQYNFRSFIIE